MFRVITFPYISTCIYHHVATLLNDSLCKPKDGVLAPTVTARGGALYCMKVVYTNFKDVYYGAPYNLQ
jgi:hypothetical protein